MKLHQDRDAFRVLIESIHEQSGFRKDVLEKDYYVVLLLEELAQMQKNGIPAYFKGGTALYKALKTTNRFSEDIDLSVDTKHCSRTQNDKRLDQATKRYISLTRDVKAGKTNRSEVVAVYTYEPVSSYDSTDVLQRFGKLKIEATSFTISEPVINLKITAMLYDLATNEQKKLLETQYNVKPFIVRTISMERIFIDKLFAAETYVRKSSDPHRAFEAAKHIYDLAVIYNQEKITQLFLNADQMKQLLDIRMDEEQGRLDGIPNVKPSEFTFFIDARKNANVRKAYEVMQNQYVFRDIDRIDYEKAMEALDNIHTNLERNPSWIDYQVETELIR